MPEPMPSVTNQAGPLLGAGVTRIPVADTSHRIRTEMPSGSTRWVTTPAGRDDLGADGRHRGAMIQPDWPAEIPVPGMSQDGRL